MSKLRLQRARLLGASGRAAGKLRSRARELTVGKETEVEDREMNCSRVMCRSGVDAPASVVAVPERSSHRRESRQFPRPSAIKASSPICFVYVR